MIDILNYAALVLVILSAAEILRGFIYQLGRPREKAKEKDERKALL